MVLAIEQMMMNADTGISEVASAVKRQGWMQVSHADEGRTELLPAGQATQSLSASLPVDDRKVPLGHACLSLDPPGQVNPAGHGTCSLDVDPGGQ